MKKMMAAAASAANGNPSSSSNNALMMNPLLLSTVSALPASIAVNTNGTINTSTSDTHQQQDPSQNVHHHLTADEKKKIQRECEELSYKLMRYYNILDIGAMVVTADLKAGVVLDVKANCGEMLYIGNEVKNAVTITTTTVTTTNELNQAEGTAANPNTITSNTTITKPSLISIASDIYNKKSTFFPKYETKSIPKDVQGHPMSSPYDAIPEKKNVKRIEFLSKVGHMYTHMYKYSDSNTSLVVNEASIAGIEQILRNYYKDGYKISSGVLHYLSSHLSDIQAPLGEVQGDPALKNVHPICWDVANVEPLIKRTVYKIKDRRSSDEARSRGKLLVTMQKRRRGVEPNENEKKKKMLKPATENESSEESEDEMA